MSHVLSSKSGVAHNWSSPRCIFHWPVNIIFWVVFSEKEGEIHDKHKTKKVAITRHRVEREGKSSDLSYHAKE
jgi:hypothetical protein